MPDVEDEAADDSVEEVVHETMFTFEAFEMVGGPRSIRTTLLIMITSPSVRNSRTRRSLGRC